MTSSRPNAQSDPDDCRVVTTRGVSLKLKKGGSSARPSQQHRPTSSTRKRRRDSSPPTQSASSNKHRKTSAHDNNRQRESPNKATDPASQQPPTSPASHQRPSRKATQSDSSDSSRGKGDKHAPSDGHGTEPSSHSPSSSEDQSDKMGNCIGSFSSKENVRGVNDVTEKSRKEQKDTHEGGDDKLSSASGSSSPPSSSEEVQHLKHRSRRRLSLIHAEPITHQSAEGPRGMAHVGRANGSNAERLSLNGALLEGVADRSRRVSVMGAATQRPQANFENKDETSRGNFSIEALQALGIGHACRKGLKPESPNQDDFFIYKIDDIGLYGVFDGHGPYGHDISNFVQTQLAQLLWNHKAFESDPRKALTEAFAQVQSEIQIACEHREFDATLSGCTATVIIHDNTKNKLYCAHLGDSRAVLAKRDLTGPKLVKAFDLTDDHKPTVPGERARIEASGGEVKKLEGDIPHRVFLKDKLYPGLAMSRAFGDLVATQAGVCAEPEINEYDVAEHDDLFMVICSDGVWEFISSQESVEMVQKCGKSAVQEAADQLAREAWNKWIVEEGDVVDDITVEIIYLH